MDSVKLHYEVAGDDFTRAGEASGDVKRVLYVLFVYFLFLIALIPNITCLLYTSTRHPNTAFAPLSLVVVQRLIPEPSPLLAVKHAS